MLKRADKHVRTEWVSGVHTNNEGFNHNNHAIAHFGKQKVDGASSVPNGGTPSSRSYFRKAFSNLNP